MSDSPSTGGSGIRGFRHLPADVTPIDPGCNAYCKGETHCVVGYSTYDDLAAVERAVCNPRTTWIGGVRYLAELTDIVAAPEAVPHPDPRFRYAWLATWRRLDG